MLYELAHAIKERCGFLWDAIEWGNAQAFSLMYRKGLKRIPEILQKHSTDFTVRLATLDDVQNMTKFFAEQPEEAFKFFRPHGFDEKSLKKIVANKAFITFLVLSGETIVGYFFLRSFVNGKSFKGYMVDFRFRKKGVAKLEGVVMNEVVQTLGIRMFGSISTENEASMAAAKAVNEVKILKTLDNGDYYIEFLPKTAGET